MGGHWSSKRRKGGRRGGRANSVDLGDDLACLDKLAFGPREALDHPGLEQDTVRRSPVSEVPEFVALPDLGARLDVLVEVTAGDLHHAYGHHADCADARIVGLDVDDGARLDIRQVALGQVLVRRVFFHRIGLREKHTGLDVGLFDCAVDRAVPAVVVERVQEGLVHATARELLHVLLLGVEHRVEGVGLRLDPEPALLFQVERYSVHRGVARRVDELVVVRCDDWACAGTKLAREEVVPGLEPVIRLARVVLVVGHVDLFGRTRTKPTRGRRVQDVARLRAVKELLVGRQDLAEHGVDADAPVGGEALRAPHRPDQDSR